MQSLRDIILGHNLTYNKLLIVIEKSHFLIRYIFSVFYQFGNFNVGELNLRIYAFYPSEIARSCLSAFFLKKRVRYLASLIFEIHGGAHAGRSQEYLMGRGRSVGKRK